MIRTETYLDGPVMTALIVAAAVVAWAVTSRWLFRYWVRNDTITEMASQCSHGYTIVHKDDPCHPRHPASRNHVAGFAILCALFLPVTLFAAAVMANPPLGRAELEEKTRALEAENDRLRRDQERRSR